ncbi:MAG TPA: hypothetical protein VJ110_03535 [Candidatus Nanoarchaeia archaeon]|nr:hypothetical protein [Candidatus Nanoarchaeia archaeon]
MISELFGFWYKRKPHKIRQKFGTAPKGSLADILPLAPFEDEKPTPQYNPDPDLTVPQIALQDYKISQKRAYRTR